MKPIRDKDNFLVFGSPAIEEAEVAEVVDSIRSGWLGTGPKVHRFEQEFKAYKQSKNAIALNSCTAALHLSILAANIGHGDEVITTPLTFCATVNAIIHAGATPVLADIEAESMNISPQAIEKKITSRTKALLPVHFAGKPCDMSAIMDIADRHKLKVIEDCAHAIETEYKGQKVGTFGDLGCFSFYVTKNVVTGEGGMILTDNDEYAARLKVLALHGMSSDAWKRFSDEGYRHYLVTEAGFKYNMMDIQAAIGIHQLQRVESNWLKRKKIWDQYDRAFADLPVTTPTPTPADDRHGCHLYTLLIDKDQAGISRDKFLQAMHKHNIGTGVHYLSLPEHPYYQQKFGWQAQDWPLARRIGRQTVSLPLSAKLNAQDVQDVITTVKKILTG